MGRFAHQRRQRRRPAILRCRLQCNGNRSHRYSRHFSLLYPSIDIYQPVGKRKRYFSSTLRHCWYRKCWSRTGCPEYSCSCRCRVSYSREGLPGLIAPWSSCDSPPDLGRHFSKGPRPSLSPIYLSFLRRVVIAVLIIVVVVSFYSVEFT